MKNPRYFRNTVDQKQKSKPVQAQNSVIFEDHSQERYWIWLESIVGKDKCEEIKGCNTHAKYKAYCKAQGYLTFH